MIYDYMKRKKNLNVTQGVIFLTAQLLSEVSPLCVLPKTIINVTVPEYFHIPCHSTFSASGD